MMRFWPKTGILRTGNKIIGPEVGHYQTKPVQISSLLESISIAGNKRLIFSENNSGIERLSFWEYTVRVASLNSSNKVGCAFPMVISSEFCMRQYWGDDHREVAPQFIWPIYWVVNFILDSRCRNRHVKIFDLQAQTCCNWLFGFQHQGVFQYLSQSFQRKLTGNELSNRKWIEIAPEKSCKKW